MESPKDILKNINPDIRDFSEQIEAFLEKRELAKLRADFIEKMTILVISAFGLIAALAWDAAFKELFDTFVNGLTALQEKFLYAGIITILAVVVSIVLTKLVFKD